MTTKIVYLFDAAGVITGEYLAQESPLEAGVFITPHQSTDVAPPQVAVNETAQFVNGAWAVIPDFRGQTQYAADGTESEVIEAGDLSASYSLTPPPKTPAQLLADYQASAKAALDLTSVTMERIQEGVIAGTTTYAAADVVAWATYRADLRVQVKATSIGILPARPDYPKGT